MKRYLLIILLLIITITGCGKKANETEKKFYKFARMNGTSMSPNYNDGDLLNFYYYDKLSRGDVVLFKYKDETMIKRVIGLPNEKITYKNNKLYINEKYIEEDYLADDVVTDDFEDEIENCYYLMGDNRIISYDSRHFGCIKEEDIIAYLENN